MRKKNSLRLVYSSTQSMNTPITSVRQSGKATTSQQLAESSLNCSSLEEAAEHVHAEMKRQIPSQRPVIEYDLEIKPREQTPHKLYSFLKRRLPKEANSNIAVFERPIPLGIINTKENLNSKYSTMESDAYIVGNLLSERVHTLASTFGAKIRVYGATQLHTFFPDSPLQHFKEPYTVE